jgi:hypothetical protein
MSITDAVPFVIPVDPVAHVRGLSAREARGRRGRGSMFAVPNQRETLRHRPGRSSRSIQILLWITSTREPRPRI